MRSPSTGRWLGREWVYPFGLNLVPRVLSYPSNRGKNLGTRLFGGEILPVVTRMDTLKSGWTPFVYCTMLYSS